MALASGWNVVELSEALTRVPPEPGRVTELGIFKGRGIATTRAQVDVKDGEMRLINETPRGGEADRWAQDVRSSVTFDVPQYIVETPLRAADVQDRRAFGSDSMPMPIEERRQDILVKNRRSFDQHKEAMRVSALRGILLDENGSTKVNYFTEFGRSQATLDLELDDDTTDVKGKCMEIFQKIRLGLGSTGGRVSGVRVLCALDLYNALLDHPKVRQSFQYVQEASVLREGGMQGQQSASFGGLVWEPYYDSVTEADGTTRALIPDGEALAFPLGPDIYQERWAPIDLENLANTKGLAQYAWEWRDPNPRQASVIGAGFSALPYVSRPDAVVSLTLS